MNPCPEWKILDIVEAGGKSVRRVTTGATVRALASKSFSRSRSSSADDKIQDGRKPFIKQSASDLAKDLRSLARRFSKALNAEDTSKLQNSVTKSEDAPINDPDIDPSGYYYRILQNCDRESPTSCALLPESNQRIVVRSKRDLNEGLWLIVDLSSGAERAVPCSDLQLTYQDQRVEEEGCVLLPTGAKSFPGGIISYPDGTMLSQDGYIKLISGELVDVDMGSDPGESLYFLDGCALLVDGRIRYPSGTTTTRDRRLQRPDGSYVTPLWPLPQYSKSCTSSNLHFSLPSDLKLVDKYVQFPDGRKYRPSILSFGLLRLGAKYDQSSPSNKLCFYVNEALGLVVPYESTKSAIYAIIEIKTDLGDRVGDEMCSPPTRTSASGCAKFEVSMTFDIPYKDLRGTTISIAVIQKQPTPRVFGQMYLAFDSIPRCSDARAVTSWWPLLCATGPNHSQHHDTFCKPQNSSVSSSSVPTPVDRDLDSTRGQEKFGQSKTSDLNHEPVNKHVFDLERLTQGPPAVTSGNSGGDVSLSQAVDARGATIPCKSSNLAGAGLPNYSREYALSEDANIQSGTRDAKLSSSCCSFLRFFLKNDCGFWLLHA